MLIEAKLLRTRPRTRTKPRGRGRGRGQNHEDEAEAEDNLSRPRSRPRTKCRPRGQSGLEDLTSLSTADTVRAINVKYRKYRLGAGSFNSEPPSPFFFQKNGNDYHVDNPTPHAKFGRNMLEGGVAAHA